MALSLPACHNKSRGDAANADLAYLAVSAGTLSPLFASGTTDYAVEVANGVSSITLTPTAAASGSSITVNGQAVSSGVASQAVSLSVGANTIAVVVTARNRMNSKTYTVTVTRLGGGVSHNADLAGIGLSAGSPLSPNFAADTLSYSSHVASGIASITLTPTAAVSTSTITVNGSAVTSGSASQAIDLDIGANAITIIVTAQDGTTTKTYTVTVTKGALWTWMGGFDTSGEHEGVYGTLGVAESGNFPGGRYDPVTWTDTSGDLWLFGGYGYDSTGSLDCLNDLWKYEVSTGNWTWVAGGDTGGQPGVYGTRGIPAGGNIPGARAGAAFCKDGDGNLWIFGGWGYDKDGNTDKLNDLWKFDGVNWTWVAGSDTAAQVAVYGVMGTGDPANHPGARNGHTLWVDSNGNAWVFGGYGYSSIPAQADLNDLWKFDGTEWTWIAGSSEFWETDSYGTQGVADPSNHPGARDGCVGWIDGSDNLYLFGGTGGKDYNDLWKFDGTDWTWVGGTNLSGQPGIYGTQGTADSGNIPGARCYTAVSVDGNGDVWLFGGYGYDSAGQSGKLNDLWKFDGENWTWVAGSNLRNQNGVYGTLGVAASTNTPGSRGDVMSWIDTSGNFWLFGGSGRDSAGNSDTLDDLWKFEP